MERNYLTASLLSAIFLSLVQVSVQQGMINYQQYQPPVLITNPLCGPGWERDPTDAAKCRAWCESGCKNGYCKTPNTCECYPGFVKSLAGDCVEECPMSCLNGYCDVITNMCTCNTGYILHSSGKFCVPQCSIRCDYPLNCTTPGQCLCPQERINLSTKACENKCDPPCGSGQCVGHNQCACFAGFELIAGVCQTKCSRPCVHGMCMSPDICSCHKNWNLNYTTNFCDPVCHGCENGECVAPDRCHCNTGYKKVDGKCIPHCSRCDSHTGNCVGPEKCECKTGYVSTANGSSCKKYKSALKKIINAALNNHGTSQVQPEPVNNAGNEPYYYQDPNQHAFSNQQPMYGQSNQQPLYPIQQQQQPYPQQQQPYPQQQQPYPQHSPPLYVQSHNFTAG